MKNKRQINIIKYLDIFDVMRTPDNGRISLIYEKAIHYNMYSVYIKDRDGADYLFERFVGGEVKVKNGMRMKIYSILILFSFQKILSVILFRVFIIIMRMS